MVVARGLQCFGYVGHHRNHVVRLHLVRVRDESGVPAVGLAHLQSDL